MVKVISFVLLSFLVAFGEEVYYCIQLASSNSAQDLEKLFRQVQDFPDPRIELIQGIYTLRVGYFSSIEEARKVFSEIKEKAHFPDPFMRRCAYKPERVVSGRHGPASISNKYSADRETLKLIISALLGVGKLEKALKVAERGTSLFPEDHFWWETYAQLLIWNDRTAEALEPLVKAYKLSRKRELLNRAFYLALALNRYDVAKELLAEGAKASQEEKELIYKETGDVEALIELLKSKGDRKSVLSLAELLFALGRKKEALETLERLSKTSGRDARSALLEARIFFSQKRFRKALEILKEVMNSTPSDYEEFWATLSDLSWMMGDYETSEIATMKLIEHKKARAGDYYRAVDILSLKDPQKAISLSLEAWSRFRVLLFLERAVDIAYQAKKWDVVIRLVGKHRKLTKNNYILRLYAEALLKTGKRGKAFALIENALEKHYTDTLLSYYLYTLIEHKEHLRLEKVIRRYRHKEQELPLPFIYSYLFLQQGNKAYKLYRRTKLKDNILKADILTLLGKEREARNLRFREFIRMKKKIRENPELLQEPEFLRRFLYVAMDFVKAGGYERMLFEARDTLHEDVWRDIYLSFLFRQGRYERIKRLARIEKYYLEPWMKINLYLYLDDRESMKELLEEEAPVLPIRDRVEALRRTGSFSKALWFAYLGLENNPEDYLLYKQKRDLVVESEDRMSLRTSFLSRKGYSELRTDGEVLIRNFRNGLGFGLTFTTALPLSKDGDILRKADTGYKGALFLEKNFSNSRLRWDVGVFQRIKPVLYLELSYEVFERSEELLLLS